MLNNYWAKYNKLREKGERGGLSQRLLGPAHDEFLKRKFFEIIINSEENKQG